MITIADCPFCGHADVEIDEVGITEYAVTCPECRCIGPICDEIMGAIAAWNSGVTRNPDVANLNKPEKAS
jgi:hypothetical protein